jgi:hypothetical protein
VFGAGGNGQTAYGVYGRANGGGSGVYGSGNGANSAGVQAISDIGYGVTAVSGTSVDLAAIGTGRFLQVQSGFAGAPTTGGYAQGEQIRDDNGDLYICVAAGVPGVWKRVAALNTAYSGGAVALLSPPIRIYDSRIADGPLIGNASRNIQVTNVTQNGVQVPSGAVGCIGNLTVTGPTRAGYLVMYPQGIATPATSAVNFVAGQTIANGFVMGLSSSGQIAIQSVTSGNVQFIIDITGFVS